MARQRWLLASLDRDGQLRVRRAAEDLGISDDTVRRDLDGLQASGLVLRTHGGAVRVEPTGRPTPLASRRITRRAAKERVGHAASDLIPDRATVLMSGGSTVLAVAGALGSTSGLRIVTNNLLLPGRLPAGAAREVYLLGGAVRLNGEVTLGPIELPSWPPAPVRADLAVIGVGGLNAQGFSAVDRAEARMVAGMIDAAARVIVVCDRSKFARELSSRIGALDLVDHLVCDGAPSGALARALAGAGVKVHIA